MGIVCEAVYCNQNYREDERSFSDIMMNRPKLLLRWKDSAGSEDDSIYIDVFRGGYLNPNPSLKEQPAASVDSVLFNMLHVLTDFMWHQYDEHGHERVRDDLLFFVRLECAMSPQNPKKITWYAEYCIDLGIQLDDAIQLLQNYIQLPEYNPFMGYFFGFRSPSKMLEECISKLNEQKAEIAAAKTVHHRPSSLKFSVGLVVICNYKKWGRNFRKPCVIVSWNVKFQESNEWKSKVTSEEDSDDEEVDEEKVCSRTKKVIPSQDQPHYHILMVDSDADNPQFQLNVPEETLELLPAAVPIAHNKIWFHFERFDGRRYVPNAEKRAQFPEDEAVTLSLIG
ncbi:F-box only protein 21-like isoform X3 [Daphnia pulicaria]|uniref:F-box only protein 21-like isoform X3 n=1 Tax=Daphnia pulicaria TaxID=35523 RepID=UPI001EECCF74|nr:F-box only protein 21-like isoform X3 [Daphnia pulicaria]